jgi:hypothetical protein
VRGFDAGKKVLGRKRHLLVDTLGLILHVVVHSAVQPVAMLGAAQRIAADALPLLTGRALRIVPHIDGAGAGAALLWETQLRAAGLDVHCFDLAGLTRSDGQSVKDLNDLTQIAPDDFEQNREVWTLTTFSRPHAEPRV